MNNVKTGGRKVLWRNLAYYSGSWVQ